MNRYLFGTIVLVLVACRPNEERGGAGTVAGQESLAVTASAPADSARTFVQRFYDWYLATEASHGSPYDSLLTVRRSLLGDALLDAFAADAARQRADIVAEIASLSAEADVFLNSQDPCPRYTARTPHSIGGDTLAVPVAGSCAGLDRQPNIEVYVAPRGSDWQILTLRDPTDPSFDLLTAFRQYAAEPRIPASPDSAHADTTRDSTD